MALGAEVKIQKANHPRYKLVAVFIDGGKRKKRYFKDKTSAGKFKEEREKEAARHGTETTLSPEERLAVQETRPTLAEAGIALREAISIGCEGATLLAESRFSPVEALRLVAKFDPRQAAILCACPAPGGSHPEGSLEFGRTGPPAPR